MASVVAGANYMVTKLGWYMASVIDSRELYGDLSRVVHELILAQSIKWMHMPYAILLRLICLQFTLLVSFDEITENSCNKQKLLNEQITAATEVLFIDIKLITNTS